MSPVCRIVRSLVMVLCLALAGPASAEIRAVYVPTFETNTRAACDRVIDHVLASKINQVYVQVRSRGDAYYYPNREDSTYTNWEPRAQLYALNPADLDVLQYYIDRLHTANPPREVHAWLTTYNIWNRVAPPADPGHVLLRHPEWVTEDIDGVTFSSGDIPLDPGIPAVRDHIHDVYLDIVRNYDIDGIHFDYIRLLSSNSGYDPVAKARFLAETGWNFDTQNANGVLNAVYRAWRRDKITELVQNVYVTTQAEKPWVDVSAFLVNFSDSVVVLGQGYNWWVKHGVIDTLHPGGYSSSLSGTIDHWNDYVNKLAQNNDQNRRPMVKALGTYLMTSSSHRQAVIDLRAHARPPEGFNFFQIKNLFYDAEQSPQDLRARDLFDTGQPMDSWVPVPLPAHKIALGLENTPPLAPAALAASLHNGVPRVQFQRPAPASDGDLPVRYRLYRDTQNPVRLVWDNLVMEWWDPGSPRTSFTFDDHSASGTVRYAAVAYDEWNNPAVATSGTVAAPSTTYIIETRAGGLNVGDYADFGTFTNSTSHSTAPGLTPDIGSRFALPGDANGRNDRARFTPSGLAAGTYTVEVTCFNFASANAQNITARFSDADGVRTTTFDLRNTTAGNSWLAVGTLNFAPGARHFVEFDNATQSNIGDSTNSRMNAAAVRLTRAAPGGGNPKEPKPPISLPARTEIEVIVDSDPVGLDYDQGSGWSLSTLSGYYNGNARFVSTTGYPLQSYSVWVVDLPQAGRWAIDGWVRHNIEFAQGARYRFVDGDGVVRNTTASQRSTFNSTTSGDWLINVDGVTDNNAYFFNHGRVYVTLWGNTAGSQTLIADALRFRLVEAASAPNASAWVVE